MRPGAPDLAAELVTITAMYLGSGPAGGRALLPGSVLKDAPQLGVLRLAAKPLKLAGAPPPLSELSCAHCAPQNVTKAACPLASVVPLPVVPALGLEVTLKLTSAPCKGVPHPLTRVAVTEHLYLAIGVECHHGHK